jgi:hypothetical protein
MVEGIGSAVTTDISRDEKNVSVKPRSRVPCISTESTTGVFEAFEILFASVGLLNMKHLPRLFARNPAPSRGCPHWDIGL